MTVLQWFILGTWLACCMYLGYKIHDFRSRQRLGIKLLMDAAILAIYAILFFAK